MLALSRARFQLCFIVCLALCTACAVQAADLQWRVSMDGFGPIRVGMTRAQAERAAGLPLSDDSAVRGAYCYYLDLARSAKGVVFMFTDSRIARIDVQATGYATLSGARIGDSEARLRDLYGERAKFSPHKYLGTNGNYVTVASADHRHAVQFETHHGRVTRYRAGRFPEVGLVEGCN